MMTNNTPFEKRPKAINHHLMDAHLFNRLSTRT